MDCKVSPLQKARYSYNPKLPAALFGDGMASYDYERNMMVLYDGFDYHLSHGLVTIDTGREFRFLLEGDATMVASLESSDPVIVEAMDKAHLKITSNISGSALKCKTLSVMPDVFLDLLSRNSQSGMYALECTDLTVERATLYAEVTTANLAVATDHLTLIGSKLQKPAGGGVNPIWGGICFADGIPAKIVRIVLDDTGLQEEGLTPVEHVRKIFERGRIVIVKDGKRYDLSGREIHK